MLLLNRQSSDGEKQQRIRELFNHKLLLNNLKPSPAGSFSTLEGLVGLKRKVVNPGVWLSGRGSFVVRSGDWTRTRWLTARTSRPNGNPADDTRPRSRSPSRSEARWYHRGHTEAGAGRRTQPAVIPPPVPWSYVTPITLLLTQWPVSPTLISGSTCKLPPPYNPNRYWPLIHDRWCKRNLLTLRILSTLIGKQNLQHYSRLGMLP